MEFILNTSNLPFLENMVDVSIYLVTNVSFLPNSDEAYFLSGYLFSLTYANNLG